MPADKLVPDDVVRLGEGERVPADATALRADDLQLDESILTGESLPVDKSPGSELFAGTLALRGTAIARITQTGSSSALGRLAGLLNAVDVSRTPLERRMETFGKRVALGVIALTTILLGIGLAVGGVERFRDMFVLAVALAVAAVPEGLPAVMTLTLALGTQRMAARRAIVRRLAAVEALGSVTVIVTDKTGTLTENRMLVQAIYSPDPDSAAMAIVLANDADADHEGVGDPVDRGLLAYAHAQGIDIAAIRADRQRLDHEAFDARKKYMRVRVATPAGTEEYFKGAPEVLLAMTSLTTDARRDWSSRAETLAGEGYRLLGLARREATSTSTHWLGLVAFWDPPRAEVPDAIRDARRAGIRVVMATGDHVATAQTVARAIGIETDSALSGTELAALNDDALVTAVARTNVFGRVSPEQKLRLVQALHDAGHVVAMTGDGVNDAPALKRANVGIAMGIRGSDVSREVADLVLLDDHFATIVAAVEEGRNIFDNIRKFVCFLFSTNLAEVLIVTLGTLGAIAVAGPDSGWLPLTAAQLLWINLVSDGLPVLAIGADRSPDAMRRPPRGAGTGLFDAMSLRFLLAAGSFMGLTGLTYFGWSFTQGANPASTQMTLFLFLGIGQLFFIYPARRLYGAPVRRRSVHLAVTAGIIMQVLAVGLPGLRTVLGLQPPEAAQLWPLASMIGASWLFAEWLARRLRRSPASPSVATTD